MQVQNYLLKYKTPDSSGVLFVCIDKHCQTDFNSFYNCTFVNYYKNNRKRICSEHYFTSIKNILFQINSLCIKNNFKMNILVLTNCFIFVLEIFGDINVYIAYSADMRLEENSRHWMPPLLAVLCLQMLRTVRPFRRRP